jgi:hypothetical protein
MLLVNGQKNTAVVSFALNPHWKLFDEELAKWLGMPPFVLYTFESLH